MKRKIKLLGHIGLVLFVLSALMLTLAPVAQAATAVTSVWVEFEYTSSLNKANDSSGTNQYLVHFKPTTALKRGVDTVTVTWPDGSATMCGTTSTNLAFSTISSMTYTDVDFSTNYGTRAVSSATWTDVTNSIICGGYRTKVKTPIDVSAGSDVWIRFVSTSLKSGSTEGSAFKVYVATSKDTTPVLSSAFALGLYVSVDPTGDEVTISPATAGAAAQYTFKFKTSVTYGALTSGTSTVTIQFPVGTTLPSSISASNVQFSLAGSTYTATGTTPVVDTNRRTVTATVSVTGIDAATVGYMLILSGAGVTNPTIASTDDYYCMISTSSDIQWFKVTGDHDVAAGSPTTVTVCNGEIGQNTNTRYSDDATMINMYSSQIYVALTDAYGNSKAPASAVTVTLSSSSGTGGFFWVDGQTSMSVAVASCTTVSVSVADPGTSGTGVGDQILYYKDSTAGTHTLTFTASGYTTATWTFKVAPAVSVYDSSNNLINTYASTSASPTAETGDGDPYTQKYASDYINSAITAAMAGDTVKLGDGIYELNSYIDLSVKVTLTSVNGASSTTLRPVSEAMGTRYIGNDLAILVHVTGTAANPVIISGLTFTRLRSTQEFDMAIYNNGYNYVTVQNCVFDYIIPEQVSDHEYGSVVSFIAYPEEAGGGDADITSATISNNTFTNCCTFSLTTWGEAPANISIMAKAESWQTKKNISGVTVSGNTLTNCNGHGIWLRGYIVTTATVTASVTDNTITNPVSGITLGGYTTGCSILRNTVTGGYMNGLWVGFTLHDSLVIKNNTFTGCAGTGTSEMDYSCVILLIDDGGDTDEVTVQYNDFTSNDAEYSIYAKSDIAGGAQTCQYNWFGSATGPAYTALTGATVTKSNPNGTGTKVSDKVTYFPWLHKSRADVVADNASYQACTMKLIAGWNTLSTPVKLISTADAIDELITSGMTIGYYYSGGWQQITTGYVLNPCDAVYVKMSAATDVLFKFDASAFSMPSKSLAAGWNLIGLAYLSSSGMQAIYGVASVLKTAANLPGYSQVVSPSLNNDTQRDLYYSSSVTDWTWTYSSGQAADTSHTMRAGLGYWIYMQNAATLAGFEITPIAPDLD